MDKRGGEYQDFPLEIFCLTVPIIFVGEFLNVALIRGTENVWIRGGGEISTYSVDFFCLTVPKIFVGESFTVALFLGTGKVWMRRGEYQDFPSKVFCLTVPITFVGESFTVAVFSGTGKVWMRRGEYQDFPSIFFVSQCRKYSQVNPFVLFFRKFQVAKKFMDKRGGGGYQDIPSKIFCLTVPIIFVGEFLFFALITGTEKVWIRGGGVSRFFEKKFLSHSAEYFCREILYCCSFFGYRKSLDK